MKTPAKYIRSIMGLTLLFGVGLALRFLSHLDVHVLLATSVVSFGIFLVAVMIASLSARSGRGQQIAQFRAEKGAAYQVFIELWQEVIQVERSGKPTLRECSEELLALDRLMITYGSREVVRAHHALRSLQRKSGLQSADANSLVVEMLLQIRKDLGSEEEDLHDEDLLSLLLYDADPEVSEEALLSSDNSAG